MTGICLTTGLESRFADDELVRSNCVAFHKVDVFTNYAVIVSMKAAPVSLG